MLTASISGGADRERLLDAGQPFYDPEADRQLFDAIKSNLRSDIKVIEMDCEINDPAFAEACANALLKQLNAA